MALAVEIVGDVPAGLDLEPTERVVSALLASEVALPDGTVNASFVDRDESQRLNRDYSGNDYATDVLSFSYIEDGEPIDGVVGELAVCYEIAGEQAAEAKIDLADEVALLVLHGTLHIAGYDHQTESQQAELGRMQAGLMMAADNAYREFKWED